MEKIEYNLVDKTDWPRGQWDNEPDSIEWEDEETHLPCLIVRVSTHGGLCGYVGIDSSHPYFNMNSNEIDDINVHGRVTFSNKIIGNNDIWWVGFDCAHAWDICLALSNIKSSFL